MSRSRPSPIIVGLLLLAVALVVGAVRIVSRPKHGREAVPAEAELPPSLPETGRLGGWPSPAGERAPANLPPAAAAGATPAQPLPSVAATIRARNLRVAVEQEELIQNADEAAFDVLSLAQGIRETIREINHEMGQNRRELLSSGGANLPTEMEIGRAAAINRDVDRLRTAALVKLLGADATKVFDATERTAIVRLRSAAPVAGRH